MKTEVQLLKINGYASVFNVLDRGMDIIAPGSFYTDDKDINKIKILWSHDAAKPIGYLTKCTEDDVGLYIEGYITTDTQAGEEAASLIKSGIISGLSIGFEILDSYIEEESDIRYITKAVLYEISVVSMPANQYTNINFIE